MAKRDLDTVAIVGNGAASAECIRALRENGHRGDIHVLTDSTWPIYNPMLTTYYVAGKVDFDGMFPYGRGDAFYEQYAVQVHPGSPVVALDAGEKVVHTQAGLHLKYDRCLVASGASPVLPRIEGITSNRVHKIRTVDDAVRLRRALAQGPRKAIVVGASLVGIKLVELFHEAGMEVCLADLADHVFPTAAHPDCARLIENRLTGIGIRLRLGAAIEGVEETATGLVAHLGDGRPEEEADLLVMCIGVRANIGFVDRNQVQVAQGIVVDERMQTSAEDLYAAGDVAQGRDLLTGGSQVIGLWANARCQGRAAGRNMAGVSEALPGNVPHNITHFMGMDFVGIGTTREYDRMEKEFDGNSFVQMFWRDGRLVGANLLDRFEESGILKHALIRDLTQGYSLPRHRDAKMDWQNPNYLVSLCLRGDRTAIS